MPWFLAALCFGYVAISRCAPASSSAQPPSLDESAAAIGLDLNLATAAELEALPGIGPAKAQAILELRQRRKGFRRVDDLLRVRGIGPATLRKLKPLVRVAAKVN